MDIWLDFTENECKAISQLTGWGIVNSADMRRAFHELMNDYAKIKGIEIPDLEEGVYDL